MKIETTQPLFKVEAIHHSDGCPWAGKDLADTPVQDGTHCRNCCSECQRCGKVPPKESDTLDWISGEGLVCLPCRKANHLATREELMDYFGVKR